MPDYSYPVTVNGRWTLRLPPHRAIRHLDEQTWEKERLASMFLNIASTDRILDIGSEGGDMSALFASWVPEGGIFLVEPNPKAWPSIKACWDANPGLINPAGGFVGFTSTCHADADGLSVNEALVPGWPSCATELPLDPEHGFRHLAEETDVTPQITVDELCDRTGFWPTVITIDVEGSEIDVLRGARVTMKNWSPLIWVSVHPQFRERGHASKFVQLMDDRGYRVTHLADDHEAHYFCEPR